LRKLAVIAGIFPAVHPMRSLFIHEHGMF